MKNKLFQLLFLTILFSIIMPTASASEVYYINKNGITMNETEYKNILIIHGESFIDEITEEMFEENKEYYSNPDIVIETVDSDNIYKPRSTSFESNYKSIKLSKVASGTSSNLIVVTVTWKSMPAVRSYDVIGVRLINTNFETSITTLSSFDGKSGGVAGSKQFSNGYGASIKLKTGVSSIKMQQSFKAPPGGTVYASYQHSVKNISLADSQSFTISSNGLGSVFQFNNNNLFDQMSGVRIGT